MAEVKYFDQELILMDLVVNQHRAVHQLAHLRPFSNDSTNAGMRASNSTWSSRELPNRKAASVSSSAM
jgi:hypothetical protein